MTRVVTGNIFTTEMQVIVNTVNCVGVMGAGLALECRLRYPEMYQEYVRRCANGLIDIGKLWLYKGDDRWILNFPTKKHWRHPSREVYIHSGLKAFVASHVEMGMQSVAFPILGAQHGGLSEVSVLNIMKSYLSRCSTPTVIYRYDATAADDLYLRFKSLFDVLTDSEVAAHSGLGKGSIEKLRSALESGSICQLNQLARVPGIGDKTLERAFGLVRQCAQGIDRNGQGSLDL